MEARSRRGRVGGGVEEKKKKKKKKKKKTKKNKGSIAYLESDGGKKQKPTRNRAQSFARNHPALRPRS